MYLSTCLFLSNKHVQMRYPKQHVSKESYSNIQLSNKDGLKEKEKTMYV